MQLCIAWIKISIYLFSHNKKYVPFQIVMFRSKNNRKKKPFYSLLVSSATMKVMISSLSVLVLVNSAPSCEPQDSERIRWYTCNHNPEKWYGISKIKGNFDIATSICADASTNPSRNPGKLFVAHNAEDDRCLFNAMQLDSTVMACHGTKSLWLHKIWLEALHITQAVTQQKSPKLHEKTHVLWPI